MAMSKKDFQVVAFALAKALERGDKQLISEIGNGMGAETMREITVTFADEIACTNPNFKRQLFIDAVLDAIYSS